MNIYWVFFHKIPYFLRHREIRAMVRVNMRSRKMKAHKTIQIIIPRVKRKPAMNIPKAKEIANLSMHIIG